MNKLVLVEWKDAGLTHDWIDDQKRAGLVRNKTAGYLIHKDKKTIKIAQTISGFDNLSGIMTIPINDVVSIEQLKKKKE